jgi:hypothetical protein
MSNIFGRKLFNELFNEDSNESLKYPNNLKSLDNKSSNHFMGTFLPQKGGSWKNSKTTTEDDVNNLISMLTSDSDDKNNFSANSTQTAVLENRIKNMMQNGGVNKKQSGGADPEKVKEACKLLEDAGYTFSVGGKNCQQYVEANTPTNLVSAITNIFTSKGESKKATDTEKSVSSIFISKGSATSSIISDSKDRAISPTSSAAVSSSTISKKPSTVTSTAIPQGSISNLTTTSETNNNETLFDTAAKMVNTAGKTVTKAMGFNASTTEGSSSSPSGTVVSSPSRTVVSVSSPSLSNSLSQTSSANKSSLKSNEFVKSKEMKGGNLLQEYKKMYGTVTKGKTLFGGGESETSENVQPSMLINEPTSENPGMVGGGVDSETSSQIPPYVLANETSSDEKPMVGGGKKKSKNSKKNSKKGKRMTGGKKASRKYSKKSSKKGRK